MLILCWFKLSDLALIYLSSYITNPIADEKRWRIDGKCGVSYPLRDNSPSECNPSGDNPCCNEEQQLCGKTKEFCVCSECIDYRTESKIDGCEILDMVE